MKEKKEQTARETFESNGFDCSEIEAALECIKTSKQASLGIKYLNAIGIPFINIPNAMMLIAENINPIEALFKIYDPSKKKLRNIACVR